MRALRSSHEASDEFAEAVRWYEDRRVGLGSEFFDSVAAMMEMLASNPEIGAPLGSEDRTRRVLVPRFPFQIVYHLTGTEIVVVAIAHLRRRPGYWKSRR
jgi:plasmid stabilization system protein ParE